MIAFRRTPDWFSGMSANGNNQQGAASVPAKKKGNRNRKQQQQQQNNKPAYRSGMDKKKAAAGSSSMRIRKNSSVSAPVYEYAQRLVDPEGATSGLSPCPVSCRALAIKKKVILDMSTAYSSTSGAGTAFGYINADPSNLIELSTRASDVLDGEKITYLVKSDPAAADSSQVANLKDAPGNQATHGPLSALGVPESGTGEAAAVSINTNTAAYTASFSVSHAGAGMTLRIEMWVAGLASKIWGVEVGPNTQVEISSLTVASFTAMHVYFKATGPGVKWSVVQNPTSGTSRLYINDGMTTKTTLGLFENVKQAEYYRITAMGVLGTYMGSDQFNGGRLAAGRVSKFWRPKTTDALDELADLPNDVHQGPLKNGFHLHWIPSTVGELSPVGISEKNSHLTRFAFALSAADVAQAFRIQITCHVEYYTTEALYGNMSFTPEPYGLGTMIAYLNQKVPVATENDFHLVKKALEHVRSAGKSGLRWILDHPEELLKAASMAASMI
jgi:hypothetical protein